MGPVAWILVGAEKTQKSKENGNSVLLANEIKVKAKSDATLKDVTEKVKSVSTLKKPKENVKTNPASKETEWLKNGYELSNKHSNDSVENDSLTESDDDSAILSNDSLKELDDDLAKLSNDSLKELDDDSSILSNDFLKELDDDLTKLSNDSLPEPEDDSSITFDCWKQILHDLSDEPSNGKYLKDIASDSRIKKVFADLM
jgi:hypothetical protein